MKDEVTPYNELVKQKHNLYHWDLLNKGRNDNHALVDEHIPYLPFIVAGAFFRSLSINFVQIIVKPLGNTFL